MASTKRKILSNVTFTWGGVSITLFKGQIIDISSGAVATAFSTALGANAADPSTTGYGGGAREALGLAFGASNSN